MLDISTSEFSINFISPQFVVHVSYQHCYCVKVGVTIIRKTPLNYYDFIGGMTSFINLIFILIILLINCTVFDFPSDKLLMS